MKKKSLIALFIAGFLILIYPHVAQWINNYLQKKEAEAFMEQELSDEELEAMMADIKMCNEKIFYDESGFRDPFGTNEEKLDSLQKCLGLTDDDAFGAIEIPKLKLVIPIYVGSSEDILSKGVGQVEGSSLPLGGDGTHTVLAGHRGMGTREMFRNVDQLSDGEEFYIHTYDGTLTYEVYRQKVINPSETDSLEIEEDKDLATLLTCHPYRSNAQRLLIQAERKD